MLLVRYQHDDLPSGRSVSGGSSAIECYRCNGFGHFARDCPTSAGIRRSALPRGGGPIRGTLAHSSKEQAYTTTLECYLCNKVGHFARDCVRGRGGPEERSLRCLKCHRRGHFAKDCRDEESRCFRCYKSGHIAKDCEEPDLCYYCNKVEHLVDILQLISPFLNMLIVFLPTSLSQRGHMSRDCPDGDLKTCFKCGGKGHIALDCPSPANSKKGEKGSRADEVLEPEDLWAAIDVAKVENVLSVAYMAVGVCRSVILDNIHNITLTYSKLTLVTYFVRHYTWFLSK